MIYIVHNHKDFIKYMLMYLVMYIGLDFVTENVTYDDGYRDGVFSIAITYVGYCDMLAGLELHWCNNLEVAIIISAMIIGVWL